MMNRDLKFFLKDTIRKMVDFSNTAQSRGVEPPPLEKPYPPTAATVDLPSPDGWPGIGAVSVKKAVADRKSHRTFKAEALSLEELSFLLWATQGMRRSPSATAYRTVPSAGCRHALETYLAVFRVEGLALGLYRYLPVEHALLPLETPDQLDARLGQAAFNQRFVAHGAATFLWTTVPERMEWRYGDASYKVIALDAGHVCQNLYLGCEAVRAGTCAIAAYDQEAADALLGLDGETEFVIYMAPVGKV